jgi:DNA helicase-4
MGIIGPQLMALDRQLAVFLGQGRYIADSDVAVWRHDVLEPGLPVVSQFQQMQHQSLWSWAHIPADYIRALDHIQRSATSINPEVQQHNDSFVTWELERCRALFDRVESQPLTQEQRLAAVVMQDRNLLVAAAGSGKTSVVVAKIAYILQAGLYTPDQILVLSFNRKVAAELQDRINRRVPGGDGITVKTFHALGLDILGTVTGTKYTVPDWASDEMTGSQAMESIVDDLCQADPAFERTWLRFLSLHTLPDVELAQFANQWEYDRYLRNVGELHKDHAGIRTLNGELVKSVQELTIANWLFLNGVQYQYETSYPYKTADSKHRQYQPDFYYPDLGLWHEHFALDEYGLAPKMWPDYAQGVRWKRDLHKQHHTQLVETTSAMYKAGTLLPELERQLKNRGLQFQPRTREDIRQQLDRSNVNTLMKFLRTFIQHYKSNQVGPDRLQARAADAYNQTRTQAFLQVALPIADAYDRRLRAENGVDFEDMINLAADKVTAGQFPSPYRLILVDELQDISTARARLVRELLLHQPGNKLFAVGDDWQSIYRFAGSDAGIMRRFEQVFAGTTATNRLTQTFRSNQGICDTASRFVQADPGLLRKQIRSGDPERQGTVRVVLYQGQPGPYVHNELKKIAERERQQPGKAGVFLLGRYNNQVPAELARWQHEFSDALDIQFSTLHKAKGLEQDYVLVLGCDEGRLGFPSQIQDDNLLELVMPQPELFPMAEERRLFYVALTRARHAVTIFANAQKPSRFATELAAPQYEGPVLVETAEDQPAVICPQCQAGTVTARPGKWGLFWGCSTYPLCNYRSSSPPQ